MAPLLDRIKMAVDVLRGMEPEPLSEAEMKYGLRWSFYDGTAFSKAWRRMRAKANDPKIYAATRLLWKHVSSTVDFYATTVYQGSLSTNGEPLAGGQAEAIPIQAQTGGEETDAQLKLGIAELWNASNWTQQMRLRPMFGACLGDVYTELIDDVEGRKVMPVTIWPGYIAGLELDSVGNVKYVAIQYPVHVKPRGLNDTTKEDQYIFRKEMDGESFRFYRDDQLQEEYPNPYRRQGEKRGFVPGIWDRHKQTWGNDGQCAFEDTIQVLMEANSFLSLAFDSKRKALASPIIIQGMMPRSRDALRLQRPAVSEDDAEFESTVRHLMERMDVLTTTSDKVGIHHIDISIREALELLEVLQKGIDRENPEGSFYERLGQVGNLTGPGADRALGNATSRTRWARAGYDTNSTKLFQMWLAIAGMRANDGTWTQDGYRLNRRQQAWLPFGMDSYGNGLLDFTIPADRPVVMPTPEESVNLVLLKESVQTEWGMKEVGIPEEVAAEVAADRRQQAQNMASAFSVAGIQDVADTPGEQQTIRENLEEA